MIVLQQVHHQIQQQQRQIQTGGGKSSGGKSSGSNTTTTTSTNTPAGTTLSPQQIAEGNLPPSVTTANATVLQNVVDVLNLNKDINFGTVRPVPLTENLLLDNGIATVTALSTSGRDLTAITAAQRDIPTRQSTRGKES
eukprot:UN10110